MPPTTSPSATPREVPVRPTRIPWARKIRRIDRKSTRLNSSHDQISYAVFCLKKKNRPVLIDLDHRRLSHLYQQILYALCPCQVGTPRHPTARVLEYRDEAGPPTIHRTCVCRALL